MLERLIPIKMKDTRDRSKLETVRREIKDLNSHRNRLINDLPYGYSPSDDSSMLIRSETWTDRQIKAYPPKHITTDWLYELGNNMWQAQAWLGMRFQFNGVTLNRIQTGSTIQVSMAY